MSLWYPSGVLTDRAFGTGRIGKSKNYRFSWQKWEPLVACCQSAGTCAFCSWLKESVTLSEYGVTPYIKFGRPAKEH